MRVRNVSRSLRFAVFVSLLMNGAIAAPAAQPVSSIKAVPARLPIQFEANLGQADSEVRYLAHGSNYSLFLTSTDMQLVLRRRRGDASAAEARGTLRMTLAGGNAHSRVAGVDELSGKVHYFIGSDPAKWHSNVATFGRVRYEDVYPGIDLVYRGDAGELEYDFVVSPGANPAAIAMNFSGTEALCLDHDGTLVLERNDGQIRMHRPFVYQESAGRRVEIAGAFRIVGPGEVGFTLGSYDESRPLIIDPTLQYSTYLGGTQFDQAQAVAVDSQGNAYIAGFTSSDDFPTVNPYLADRGPAQAAFVSKLSADGTTLVYSTYLGGNDNTGALGIAVDAAGEAIVTGQTTATDFPTANAIQSNYGGIQDAFVTMLSTDGGSLVYSTYLGGTGGDGGTAVAVDSSGNAYVTGPTNSIDFPTLNSIRIPTEAALNETFVAKLTPAGAFVYSTYIGASSEDSPFGIAVDAAGAAYVVGQTSSPDFPVTPGAIDTTYGSGFEDGFALKLNAAGSAIVYATYLGGSDFDTAAGVAVNAAGEAWAAGFTQSADFPSVHPLSVGSAGLPDAFVVKLSATGGGLFSTYLGGSSFDSGIGITVDGSGNAYVTGVVDSTDFPNVNALQPTLNGIEDAYVTKISASGSQILYSTYLGGSSDEQGIAVASDSAGGVVVVGRTNSSDFPTLNPAQSENAGGFGDAFATRIAGGADPVDLDLFLRATGQPPALTLLPDAPTSSAYTSRNSGPLKYAKGNPWVQIGSWTANPTPAGTLSGAGSLSGWMGLKNSNEDGGRFDLRIELRRNGDLIAEGGSLCVQNLTHKPATATPVSIAFDSFSPVALTDSDTLSVSVSARIGTDGSGAPCGGHPNVPGLVFYFDSVQQPSELTVSLTP